MQLNPYLFFNGNCEEAFKFYAQTLGAKIERKQILHAMLRIGDQVLMASDAPAGRYEAPQGFSISLNLQDPAEAERIFHALAKSGKVTMPIAPTFWADRFGMLVDQFGIPWMVNCAQAATKAA